MSHLGLVQKPGQSHPGGGGNSVEGVAGPLQSKETEEGLICNGIELTGQQAILTYPATIDDKFGQESVELDQTLHRDIRHLEKANKM
ncbi:unnamed protein product [Caretta caretta]